MDNVSLGLHYTAGRAIFDLTFWVVVIIVLLNMVFGIIVDTFAELRQDKQAVEEDMVCPVSCFCRRP